MAGCPATACSDTWIPPGLTSIGKPTGRSGRSCSTALRDAGWRNYSLFLREDGTLIGYVEADDLAEAQARVAATEVNARWQAAMAELFASEWSSGRGLGDRS